MKIMKIVKLVIVYVHPMEIKNITSKVMSKEIEGEEKNKPR